MSTPAAVGSRKFVNSRLADTVSYVSDLAWSAVYLLLMALTGAFFMADTVDYVTSALDHERGLNFVFWDFRHLFWRPLGWLLFHISKSFIAYADVADERAAITRIFIVLNWIAGLVALLLLRRILMRFCSRTWAVAFALASFLFAQGFMNYVHSGSSYVFGLGLLITGIYLLAVEPEELSWSRVCGAALALALAVCFWFPYFFAVPGALAVPLLVSKRNWRSAIQASIICLGLGLLFYGAVILHLNLHSTVAIKGWVTTGAADVAGVRGPKRTIFGLARSFVNMGQDGVLYKRFLLHDRYNPVSWEQLVRLSIVKLALFYLLLFAILWRLWRNRTPVLALFLCGFLPVVVFGLYWYGGDVERYLPLYPFFFVALAAAIEVGGARWTRTLAILFLAMMVISNLSVMSALSLHRQEKLSEDRLQALIPVYKPHSRVVLVDIHDELENFSRSFPLLPIVNRSDFAFYPALNPGTPQTAHWREDFARIVLKTWDAGGDIWISDRLFQSRPAPDSAWVEGDDQRVKWSDTFAFFNQFRTSSHAGAMDGFRLLTPESNNRNLLSAYLDKTTGTVAK